MFEKHLRKSDIHSEDVNRWPASRLKISFFPRCFSNILPVKANYLVSPYKWNIGRKWVKNKFQIFQYEVASNCNKFFYFYQYNQGCFLWYIFVAITFPHLFLMHPFLLKAIVNSNPFTTALPWHSVHAT